MDINEIVSDEQIFNMDDAPYYVDIVNYFTKFTIPPDYWSHQKKIFFFELKYYFWKDSIFYGQGID